MWVVSTVLGRADQEHFHHCGKVSCFVTLLWNWLIYSKWDRGRERTPACWLTAHMPTKDQAWTWHARGPGTQSRLFQVYNKSQGPWASTATCRVYTARNRSPVLEPDVGPSFSDVRWRHLNHRLKACPSWWVLFLLYVSFVTWHKGTDLAVSYILVWNLTQMRWSIHIHLME